jgi:hypothetical protein
MTTTDRLFVGSIPRDLRLVLVPLIFEPYALDLAERPARTKPKHVLEVAAGTGALHEPSHHDFLHMRVS